ncbi:putative amidoligase domain-containing protein [Effusibacillus dendaii]|uniref:Phage phiEco32-like COOH-NH2 ligase-type 2 n=1 Tax=Effusibacillus dendaii TaxID=2743772 RepID=A0A7I8D6I9_9BACL|nr:hypothetical protein [Effusibacillus dendaii]BCJ85734.1 hypothetical protein skT53_07190 [Effusibacillus dendaii]
MGYLLLHNGQQAASRLLRRIPSLAGVEGNYPLNPEDRVIRWGSTYGNDMDADVVLNPRSAIFATRSKQEMISILQQYGVRCLEPGKEKSISFTRYYRVPVFNMRALALFRAEGKTVWLDRRISQINEKFKEVSMETDRYATRVTRMAIRAIHTLGLDFGIVSVGVSEKGLTYVIDLSPTPVLRDRLLTLYSRAIQRWMEEEESDPVSSFTMGADLEFMLKNREGKMVLASKFLPRQGSVGCDALSIRRDGTRFPLAEIRPEPDSSPLHLVKNIEETLLEARQLLPRRLLWLAGSMPFRNYGIGGHIHFSNLPLSSRLVKALDNYLALPIAMIENPQTSAKRRPKYGFLGDIRLKSYGGWEYRTLSSWLVSPTVTTAVLCLAHLAATHYKELNRRPLLSFALQDAFYRGNQQTLRPYFDEIWRDIQSTSTYEMYKDQLEIIPTLVHSEKIWDESTDIRATWGIEQISAVRKGR